jgi:hypothetical protein
VTSAFDRAPLQAAQLCVVSVALAAHPPDRPHTCPAPPPIGMGRGNKKTPGWRFTEGRYFRRLWFRVLRTACSARYPESNTSWKECVSGGFSGPRFLFSITWDGETLPNVKFITYGIHPGKSSCESLQTCDK